MTDDLKATLARLDELYAEYERVRGKPIDSAAMFHFRTALMHAWPLLRRCAAAWVKVERQSIVVDYDMPDDSMGLRWKAWDMIDEATAPTPLAAVEAVEATNPQGEPQ